MFTPPPSPLPPSRQKLATYSTLENEDSNDDEDLPTVIYTALSPPPSVSEAKRRIGHRTKWAAVLVPLALVLITVSTRYLTHPVVFDKLSRPAVAGWDSWGTASSDWKLHRRHPADDTGANNNPPPSSTAIAFPSTVLPSSTVATVPISASTTAATAQPLPTIPSTPPDLPKPFPQPFDSDISKNFSSVSCFNFFTDMINRLEFRSCRPFSLLLQSSDTFLQAQNNLTALNTIIWGTCNTNTTETQCIANMASFAADLQSECAQDLSDNNSRATSTLIALNAYQVMRETGCQSDPSTNTYCYVNAVHNSNPSDLYFYSLPLGLSLPKNSSPTCSACTRTLMGIYADALTKDSKSLVGLKKTYDAAAQTAVSQCGSAYATLGVINAAEGRWARMSALPALVAVLTVSTWQILDLLA